jgi:archaemetzincin
MRIIYCFLIFLVIGCKNKSSSPVPKAAEKDTIYILPLGKIPAASTAEVYRKLEPHFSEIILLPAESIPASSWYAPRKRHRADSIIEWLRDRAAPHEKYLALTNVDISTTKGEIKDYGVMGLGFRPGRAAVASSYRLKDKNNFYKVAIHELGHNSGLPHCEDRTCYLRNAKGGDHTSEEKSFCSDCQQKLEERGWRF